MPMFECELSIARATPLALAVGILSAGNLCLSIAYTPGYYGSHINPPEPPETYIDAVKLTLYTADDCGMPISSSADVSGLLDIDGIEDALLEAVKEQLERLLAAYYADPREDEPQPEPEGD